VILNLLDSQLYKHYVYTLKNEGSLLASTVWFQEEPLTYMEPFQSPKGYL